MIGESMVQLQREYGAWKIGESRSASDYDSGVHESMV
mgnify:CR=1 FL=1